MRKLFTLYMVLMSLHAGAQQTAPDSAGNSERTHVGAFLHKLSVELPDMLAYGFQITGDNRKYSTTPYPLDQLYHPATITGIGTAFGVNIMSISRTIAITWNDRFGIDVARAAYFREPQYDLYRKALQQLRPEYFIDGVQPYNTTYSGGYGIPELPLFRGWVFGVHYNIKLGKYHLQPAFLCGFTNEAGTTFARHITAEYSFKEVGSSYTLRSSVKSEVVSDHKGAYLAQATVCRYFSDKKELGKHLKFELGLKTDFALVPYSMRTTITEQPWRLPESVYVKEDANLLNAFNALAYLSLRWN